MQLIIFIIHISCWHYL